MTKRRIQHRIVLGFWIALIAAYSWYAWRNNLTPLEVADLSVGLLRQGWGPLVFVLLYAVRSLLLFPATVLTVLGGFVFGPILGVLYTIVAANCSALMAYMIGRFFGSDVASDEEQRGIRRYIEPMRRNSFETILIMRLIFLPYDLVNYAAGFLRIDWRAFMLATALGALPGTIAFVLLGASFSGSSLVEAELSLNPWALVASLLITLLSIALSRWFKRRGALLATKSLK